MMKIELVTTKVKLTKSIINQMKLTYNPKILQHGIVLGYVINVVKTIYKAIVIEYESEYYIISANWEKGESSIYRKVGKYSQKFQFTGIAECSDWWVRYQSVLKKAHTQIYI